MSESQFLGLLVGSIGTLLGIASVIVAIIIKPIINLNKSITKLNDGIDRLNGESESLSLRITKHGEEIDENTRRLDRHDVEINHLKERIK